MTIEYTTTIDSFVRSVHAGEPDAGLLLSPDTGEPLETAIITDTRRRELLVWHRGRLAGGPLRTIPAAYQAALQAVDAAIVELDGQVAA